MKRFSIIIFKHNIKLSSIIFLCLTGIVALFFLINSLLSGTDSGNVSGGIVELIKSLFFPNLDYEGTIILTTVIRKLAHFTEFGIFMGFFNCFMLSITEYKNKAYIFLTLFLALLCPMLDESVQYFSPGRTPSVADAWVDFGGELCGMLVSTFIYTFISKKYRKRLKNT